MRRIDISHVTCFDADSRFGCVISGIPGNSIEDVTLSDIRIVYKGGFDKEIANIVPPENPRQYPEPSMFGLMPSSGFFLRHVKNIVLRDVQLSFQKPDFRPTFYLEDVQGAEFLRVTAPLQPGVERTIQKGVSGLKDQL